MSTPNHPTDLPVADQVKNALIDVAAEFGQHLDTFDPTAMSLFGQTARHMLRDVDPSRMIDEFAGLMVTAFMAGRAHAAAGFPSPTPADDDADAELTVPNEWC